MRKILIALVVAFLLTIGILDLVFTNKSFNKIEAQTLEISKTLEGNDFETAKKQAYELEKTWDKEMRWMQVFIMYSEIKPISEKIARIVSLIEMQHEESLMEVDALILEIQDVHEIYKFNLPNLF